jgi:HAD superfamily hydrolase (TIGR01509 family)
MPKALIFDIDGTLVDSVDLHAKAWQEAFEHFGHEFSLDQIRMQIGKGGDQLLPVFLSKDEIEKRGKEIEEFRGKLFKSKYLKQVKPFPKVRELFEKAQSYGLKIALASSAKADELEDYKRIANIADLVDTETSSSDAERSKPHPDIFEAALEKLGPDVKPSEAVVIGDSPYDAQAAHKAGISTVCVRCGGFPEDNLKQAGCVAIYDDPQDLLEHFEQSPLQGERLAAKH